MLNAKAVHTPLPTSQSLTLVDGTFLTNASVYRTIVGSLQDLSLTLPDIMHKPTTSHWTTIKRLLYYLYDIP